MTQVTMKHWIDGQEVVEDGVDVVDIVSPTTGAVIGGVCEASVELVERAIASAQRAQKEWAQMSLARRTAVLFRFRNLIVEHRDELAATIAREGGKTLGDADGEIARGLEVVEFACGIHNALKGDYTSGASTGVDVHTIRQPVGVIGCVCPFNFPMMVPMWMHPMALATGNAVVLKPAMSVPTVSLMVAKLYQEAGLPDGLFQVVTGDKQVVTTILESDGIAAVSFVGSTPVARIVAEACGRSGKRFQALGGANNHAIVMPDANLDFAAKHIVSGAFGAAGQRCMALPVVVAVGDAADPLIAKVKERAEALVIGPGEDPKSELGPVISEASRERITSWIDEAEQAGATVVLDGRGVRPDGDTLAGGHWLGPTILDNVPLETKAYCQEVFGPVLVVVRADSYEQAIEIVNASEFGNGSAIFTESGDLARRFELDVEAGMVGINVPIPVPVGYYSFGGWKGSLFGDVKIHGQEGVNFYTQQKVITTRWAGRPDEHVGLDFTARDAS
ncbi:CoA-acylating methylmalonate-semialdehyde dehydrogenase [uncultured Tessaracoccus sp.]|uniref:CoA-acylating methylmalonate-semialdehyde dehydrogenase n=1 Tax=uncultured Tessaracoccus sp. TaxID=905023 RepID=UPI0025E2A822|nr:CoA-acylating methylmalonate-semialdehyde dehydrogenase [uncultured Tessaracoccus sp.]